MKQDARNRLDAGDAHEWIWMFDQIAWRHILQYSFSSCDKRLHKRKKKVPNNPKMLGAQPPAPPELRPDLQRRIRPPDEPFAVTLFGEADDGKMKVPDVFAELTRASTDLIQPVDTPIEIARLDSALTQKSVGEQDARKEPEAEAVVADMDGMTDFGTAPNNDDDMERPETVAFVHAAMNADGTPFATGVRKHFLMDAYPGEAICLCTEYT